MPLDESVVAAVANSNFKAAAERATQNADAHQNRLYMLAESSTAQQLNRMNSLDPTEAAAISKVQNSDLGAKIIALTAAISAGNKVLDSGT